MFLFLICILFKEIYPIDATLMLRKGVFSIVVGILSFCLTWSLNSFDRKNDYAELILVILSMIIRSVGGLILGYGIFSLINICF